MKMSTPRFRRPASLSLADQDLLPGEPDPATSTDLAHRSAEALVAQARQSADDEVMCCVTVWPVLRFSMTAVPDVVDDAVTVSLTLSPALKLMPLKSYA